MRVLLVDCDDSFTLNISDYLKISGVDVSVINHANIKIEDLDSYNYSAIVLSPGPNRPEDIPVLNKIISKYYNNKPILGICLGHQALGMYFGYELGASKAPMHGISVLLKCSIDPIFEGIDSANFYAMRYNSLAISIPPPSTEFTAICFIENGEIMGCKHGKYPIYSFQFHPESIGTPQGLQLLKNWVKIIENHEK